MNNKNEKLIIKREMQIDGIQVLERVASIIETRKFRAASFANSEIHFDVLGNWALCKFNNS